MVLHSLLFFQLVVFDKRFLFKFSLTINPNKSKNSLISIDRGSSKHQPKSTCRVFPKHETPHGALGSSKARGQGGA